MLVYSNQSTSIRTNSIRYTESETRLKELFKQLKTRHLRWGYVLYPADVLLYKDQYTRVSLSWSHRL
jgi:hypothetical protein